MDQVGAARVSPGVSCYCCCGASEGEGIEKGRDFWLGSGISRGLWRCEEKRVCKDLDDKNWRGLRIT